MSETHEYDAAPAGTVPESSDAQPERNAPIDIVEYIREAELLLAYAAQSGLELDQEIVSTIVASSHQFRAGNWSAETETRFWWAFDAIARVVKPVTIASLKANHALPGKKAQAQIGWKRLLPRFMRGSGASLAEATVSSYNVGSLLILSLLLLVQIYWLVGTEVSRGLREHLLPAQELQQKLETAERDLEHLDYQIFQIENEVTRLLSKDEDTTSLQEALERIKTAYSAKEAEVLHLKARHRNYSSHVQANGEMIKSWENVWRTLTFMGERRLAQEAEEKKLEATQAVALNLILLQEAEIFLQTIQLYVLPLLYGLLGSFAYVLRTMSMEIRSLVYSDDSNIRYRLRIQLGALAGLAVGWFIPDDSSQAALSFQSLSPLALAFLAGYSVELLFSMMDRIINTFSWSERGERVRG